MDRGAWWDTDCGIRESDMTEWLTHTSVYSICNTHNTHM